MLTRALAIRLGVMVSILGLLAVVTPRASAIVGGGAEANSVEARQFRIDNARLPGRISVRQSVIAYQVTQGTWNGQVLDGLSLVFVKSNSDDGSTTGYTNCYVSHEATLAQRQALLAAFLASQAQGNGSITARDIEMMRMESAVISIEIEGQNVVLHLGLVA